MAAPDHSDDPVQSLIDDLLVRWDEALERGERLTVDELCRDRPELAGEVERQIRVLGVWEGFVDTAPATGGERQPAPPVPTPGPTVISMDLTNLRFHARGGLGAVFRAHDARLARDLAVKFPGGAYGEFSDRELEQRLLREVSVTAALEHPGIVPVYGVGQDADGHPCYAMRFIAGNTLKTASREYHAASRARNRKRVRREPLHRDVEFRALLSRFRSACVTVAFAHGQGFLHRDLKPDHILLGDYDVTLVVDWGLTGPWQGHSGSADEPDLTGQPPDHAGAVRTEVGIGTLGYASPEQQAGDWPRVGPASDVFSLGATLYVLLTGRPPFAGASAAEIISRVECGLVIPPRKRNRAIPRALEAICMRALAPRPEDRYESAQALADDLERWLADAPVLAHRDHWATRGRRWIDRHRTGFFACLAASAVAACMLTVSWHFHGLHAIEDRSLAYATAEKTVREHVLARQAGWVTEGLAEIARAARISTPLRSDASLRALAISCLGGIDLQAVGSMTNLPVGCLAFSPDGAFLAVGELFGEQEYHIELHDVQRRKPAWRHVLSSHGDADHGSGVSSIGFSPDGRRMAAGLRNGKILIWESLEDPTPLVAPGRHTGRVIGVGFGAGSDALISGSEDGVIMLRDRTVDCGWLASRTVEAAGSLNSLVVSRDGCRVLCAGTMGSLRYEFSAFRDPAPPKPPAILKRGPVARVAFAPDATTTALSTGSSRSLLIGADGEFNTLVDPDLGIVHQDETDHLEFSPDGALLASGSHDNTVKLWDTASMRIILRQPVFSESVVIPTFHPGGRMLAVGSTRGVVLYDLLGLDTLTTVALGRDPLTDFAFQDTGVPDRTDLIAFRASVPEREKGKRTLEFWNSGSSVSPVREVPISVHPGMRGDDALRLEVNMRARRGLFRALDTIHVFELESPELPGRASRLERSGPFCFSPDGSRLWGVLRGESIVSWGLPDLTERTRWDDDTPHERMGRVGISCLAAGSSRVVAGTLAGRFLMMGATEGAFEREVRVSGPIGAVAISPDESVAVCGTQKGDIDVVRLAPGLPVLHIPAHTEMITEIAFHPAGRLLVTSSRDGFLGFWEVGASVVEIARVRASQGGSARMIRFSPDGRFLGVLFPGQRAVRVWDLERLRERLEELGLGWDVRR